MAAPLPGSCSFYVEKKRRFCKMVPAKGRRFCGEHATMVSLWTGWCGWLTVLKELGIRAGGGRFCSQLPLSCAETSLLLARHQNML